MTSKAYQRFLIAFLACMVWYAPLSPALSPQPSPDNLPGAHRGAVTALARNEYGDIFSAGADGFVGLWNTRAIEERYQISRHELRSFVLRPGKPQIAVLKRVGFDHYLVSAWDYLTRENLFTLRLRDPITSINYAASGGFLILARGGARAGVMFLHPETGEEISSPAQLSGPVIFAATGRTERVMVTYRSSGLLSYWELETGEELFRFNVPPQIRSPILIGSSRFLVGLGPQGLLVIDAATGSVLAANASLNQGFVFAAASDAADSRGFVRFYALSLAGGSAAVYHLEVNLDGALNVLNRRIVPAAAGPVTSALATDGEDIILGTESGRLWLLGRTGARAMDLGSNHQIMYAAASSTAVAFISECGAQGFLPLDFSRFSDGDTLALKAAEGHTRIVSSPLPSSSCSFLFWQPGIAAAPPLLKTPVDAPQSVPLALPPHFPLRAADMMGNSVLVLNTTGGLSVLDRESGKVRFSHSVPGSMDAAFVNEDTVIFARSVAAGNTPFLMINISTGETVPLAYPAVVGTRVYRGSSGAVYGAVINQAGERLQTSIIRLNTAAPLQSERLVEYDGEDSDFSMAESGGNLASTLGSGAATLLPKAAALERSRGLPVSIGDGGRWFITLDGDGGITWHDNQTGGLLATFRLHPDRWVLERGREIIGGPTVRR